MSLSKQQISRQFSRAASTYNGVASLQNEMADRLIGKIPVQSTGTLVDFGCGTGYALAEIAGRTRLDLIGVDLAPGMIEKCRQRLSLRTDIHLFIDDLEQTSLGPNTADWAFSNAAIQWCDSSKAMFEMSRILKTGGRLMLSTFGPDTLLQWKAAWHSIGDRFPRVHNFESESDLRQSLTNAKFDIFQISTHRYDLQFESVAAMFRSIKNLGATNAMASRNVGLLGRNKFLDLCRYFEDQLKQCGQLTLTFEAIFIEAEMSGKS